MTTLTTNANKIHKGQNVAAGLTEIANEALAEAVDQFASRPGASTSDRSRQPLR
jgi:hypothetical protein